MDAQERQLNKMVGELPPLDDLASYLGGDPELILAEAFRIPGEKAIIWPGTALDAELDTALNQEVDNVRKKLLLAGRQAVDKLRSGTTHNNQLSQAECLGLELIHAITGRPALLIQNGMFVTPPPSWEVLLEEVRDVIETTHIPPVGRIAVRYPGYSQPQPCGTGFLVGERLIMTNRHVAEVFCSRGTDNVWRLHPERAAMVDFRAESGLSTRHEFEIEEVVGVHHQVDLALLQLAPTSSLDSESLTLPEPMVLASQPPSKPLQHSAVYIVGYPMTENVWSDPLLRMLIFNNIYWVKRLQPGRLISHDPTAILIKHDCSTLGGNSGSPVIDLASHQVIGLHFSGAYLQNNNAVALWQLRDDPLLTTAGVNFA